MEVFPELVIYRRQIRSGAKKLLTGFSDSANRLRDIRNYSFNPAQTEMHSASATTNSVILNMALVLSVVVVVRTVEGGVP
ncbi:hypothetical protein [Desulfopila sp. IMCC35006]|uniref:hypothetical protein n=1 Tax=Desulfopila sp. IMCC35006 TaxID=2569542 RepID=UPI0010AD6270|nr:hypothetical protein [Desulfopila sp. IMCC35006]